MNLNSIFRKLFPPDICDACGHEIIDGKTWHELHCTDKVLGYDLYDETFARSTRVYYFNIYQKGRKHDITDTKRNTGKNT